MMGSRPIRPIKKYPRTAVRYANRNQRCHLDGDLVGIDVEENG